MKAFRSSIVVYALASLFLSFFYEATPAQGGDWWNKNWRYRRKVEILSKSRSLYGIDACYAVFPTANHTAPGGRDIRVVAKDQVIPYRVLLAKRGKPAKILFQRRGGLSGYTIYYGNPNAPQARFDWEPRGGLFLETRQYMGGSVHTWQGMLDVLRRSSNAIYDVAPVPNVFLGYNPFGPQNNFVSVFRGCLLIPATGQYDFATTSSDASFLLIDGNRVVQWPGTHRAVADARFHKVIYLDKGLHRFLYVHAKFGGRPIMEAAWRQPGQTRYVPIPPEAFPRALTTRVMPVESIEGRPVPDMTWTHVAETLMNNRHPIIKYSFRNITPQHDLSTQAVSLWEFGDGTSGRGRRVEHVYFKPGLYTITLTIRSGPKNYRTRQPVLVERNWTLLRSGRYTKPLAMVRACAHYDFEAMDSSCLVYAMKFFKEAQATPLAIKTGRILVFEREDLGASTFADIAKDLGNLYIGDKKYEKAIEVYDHAEKQIRTDTGKARMAILKAIVFEKYLKEPGKAFAEYEKVTQNYTRADSLYLRQAYIGLGDAYRWKLDSTNARRMYAAAMKIPIENKTYKYDAVQIGMLSRAIEDYLRRGDLETASGYLDSWVWQMPEEKLRGQWSILRARFLILNKQRNEAVRELETLLAVNPTSPYAGEALWILAETYGTLQKYNKQKNALQSLVKDYPESPYAEKARKKLKQLNAFSE